MVRSWNRRTHHAWMKLRINWNAVTSAFSAMRRKVADGQARLPQSRTALHPSPPAPRSGRTYRQRPTPASTGGRQCASSLLRALGTTADIRQMEVEVLVSIVIRELFVRFDRPQRKYKNPAAADSDDTIRIAGVVDETSLVRWDVSVDHGRIACPEQILSPVFPDLFGRGRAPHVFDDECSFGDAVLREEPPAAV